MVNETIFIKTFLLFQIQAFIEQSRNYLKGGDTTINQTIETIKINTKWTSKFYHKVVDQMVKYTV